MYTNRLFVTGVREELVLNLSNYIEDVSNQYKRLNKQLPQNIVILRDGVSDAQMGQVLEEEV